MNLVQFYNEYPTGTRRISKYVSVTDDWHPCFKGNKVRVTLMRQRYGKYDFIRICAWGADDFGLEMDFEGTPEENRLKFKEWKQKIYDRIPEPCNKDYFKSLGFYPA